LRRAGANQGEMRAEVDRALAAVPKGKGPAYLSTRLLDLLGRAERDADRERAREVSLEHMLGALSQEIRGAAGVILSSQGIGPGSLKPHFAALRSLSREAPFRDGENATAPEFRDLVRDGSADPVIGRDVELRRLVTILERRDKNHPLLVGEPGVGKRAIVRALARRLASGDVPTRLSRARLLEVDVGALASGARQRSELEARVREARRVGGRGRRRAHSGLLLHRAAAKPGRRGSRGGTPSPAFARFAPAPGHDDP